VSEAAPDQKTMLRAGAPPLAIIGIGCLFPKAENLTAYWSNIVNGIDAITDVPPTHWRIEDYYAEDPKAPDHVYAAKGGFLSPVDFNPMKYGILPNAIEATDTSQLLALVAAEAALKDAGYGPDRAFDRDRVSVILGVTGTLPLVIPLGARLGFPIWRDSLKEAGIDDEVAADVMQRIADSYVPWQEHSFPGLLGNVVAGRVAKCLNLSGTNCVVDAACASTFSALHLAGMELVCRQADMVVTGGVDTFNDVFMYACFSKTPALSPSGHARPFDASADGTTLGEGLGIVVLKRLEDAERDGDRIYAVVRGIGTSSDGREVAIYAPSADGQKKALQRAYEQTGISPDTVELIEGHGTGTKAGDTAELAALRGVYGEFAQNGPWCALGSVKSQIGHTKAAAGAAGLIKAAMALHTKVLPPTIKVTQPAKDVAPGQSPFYVNTAKRPWLPRERHPRRAAVSSFGFGGSNYHCLLEEYRPEKTGVDWDGAVQVAAFSGADPMEVKAALDAFPAAAPWHGIRRAAARSRQRFHADDACRLLMVLERGRTDLQKASETARTLIDHGTDRGVWAVEGVFYGCGKVPGKLAMVFSGQGAQRVGMFRDLACAFPQVLTALADADAAFAEETGSRSGKRLSDFIYPCPAFDKAAAEDQEKALRATQTAQPAIGALSAGVLEILRSFGILPDVVAGHSYGELTALYAAGRIDRRAFHALSSLRGRLMAQGGGDRGAMLAVRASESDLAAILAEEGLELTLANKNAPTQTVLSGATEAIEQAAQILGKRDIRATRLQVAAAFHSSFVAAASAPLRKMLDHVEFAGSSLPVYSNTMAAAYPANPAHARELLASQLARPVEFVREIEAMYADGVRTFLEVGPGSAVTGLINAILSGRDCQAFAVDASGGKRSGFYDMGCVLARLAALGYGVALNKWDEDAPAAENETDDKKPALTIPICGANYVKARPKRPSAPHAAPAAQGGSQSLTPAPAATTAPNPSTGVLAEAFRLTQENMVALQRMQEQTARLHHQFLESQEAAARTFQELADQQRRWLQTGGMTAVTGGLAMRQVGPPAAVLSATGDTSAAARGSEDAVRAPEPVPALALERVERALLEVVAEKTGYPVDMLSLDMSLDSDLGIDSIKRVEILSALQERLPGMSGVEPEDLGRFQSLRDVAAFVRGMPASGTPTGASGPAHSPSGGSSTGGAGRAYIGKSLLDVVAEKTGYPVDMLALDMSLDSDLGIDSIKRVEILSALQDRLPDIPSMEPDDLGKFRTLRDVVDLLCGAEVQSETGQGVSPATVPVEIAPALTTHATALQRSVLQVVALGEAAQTPGTLTPGAAFWVMDDGSALGAAIVAALTERQYAVKRITRAGLARVKVPASLDGLIILTPENPGDAFLKNAFKLAQRAASALRGAGKERGAVFVTVSCLDGAFGLSNDALLHAPLSGGLAGLAKTAAREWPEVHCKAIDLAPDFGEPDACAAAIVEEAFLAGVTEVGLSRGGRKRLQLVSAPLEGPPTDLPLLEGDLVVVSGGARGVTAEIAIALARACRPALLLLGRSPAPMPEPDWLAPLSDQANIKKALLNRNGGTWTPKELEAHYRQAMANREMLRNMERIASAGAEVFYRSVDVRKADDVAKAVDEVRAQAGPVKGLVHGAGVIADRLIEDKTDEDFEKVYTTKVEGLRALLSAVGPDQLKALVLFSSSAARFGRAGQADYAIANEVLNKMAQAEARRRPGCRVVSVNWGPWAGGMVTPSRRKVFEREGLEVIGLEAGANYLVQELAERPGAPVEVVVLSVEPVGSRSSATGGAEMPTDAVSLPVALEFELDVARHPFLKSHVIDGRAVVPLAIIVEWLAHGALHGNPGLRFMGFDELRELKGAVLSAGQARTLRVLAGKAIKSDDGYLVSTELRSTDEAGRDVLHARATVVLGTAFEKGERGIVDLALDPFPRDMRDVYADRLLFHGSDFQGVESVEGCSVQGIAARVRCAPAPGAWVKEPLRSAWLADPLALDSSFQMMVLWTFERTGAVSLPAFVRRYRQFRAAYPPRGVRVVIQVLEETRHRASADVEFLDRDTGELVARIDHYECVVDASLNDQFRRNRLSE
jgi:acyl transferase domain-containing protein/NAD(P)-dependent dehydrogenase (short-subunit alcohol dehydrogenase family)